MKHLMLVATLLVGPLVSSFPAIAGTEDPVQTVDFVDLEKYQGTWYEIAAIPQRFQKDCVASSANYSLRRDGRVKVVNTCRKSDGSHKTANGVAWAVDDTNSKLKVRFFWPFSGDYWVLELADDYSYVVVGHPDREYLWILARTPEISQDLFDELADKIKNVHRYDLSRIVRTGP